MSRTHRDAERNLRGICYMDNLLMVPPEEFMERLCPIRWIGRAGTTCVHDEHRCYRDRQHAGSCECVCGEPNA